MVRFVIPGAPEGKARPRFTGRGVAYTPAKTRAYETRVREAWEALGEQPFPGAVVVRCYAYYPIPKSGTKKATLQKLANLILPTKKPDWDNIGKIVCDALNGLAWADDSQVTDGRVIKRYAAEPRVVVEMEPDFGPAE